jgi:hypothetical protein
MGSIDENRAKARLIDKEIYSRVVQIVGVTNAGHITMDIDLGFDQTYQITCGLHGVDIPPQNKLTAVDYLNGLLSQGDYLTGVFKKKGEDYEVVLCFDFAPYTVNTEIIISGQAQANEEWTEFTASQMLADVL